ncbi:hypothetical protein AVANS14531_03555 [Campylobacter sp. Cr9]|uniref:DUF6394 family protein n=1 Tax=unclassified Campylobacter TaxID=2593542 RepID=UPI001EFC187C|nr:DUF6394 family protein [Campylobacter sp. RM5004]MBZ7985413.1 hypothetical protein [Campylobacter sp. Cr9]ULO01015.1 putative membrane protein [Campylobacter sp. RM5004]
MDFGRVIHIFFTLMSLTTTAGFLYYQSPVALFIAASINLISTFLKIGVRNILSTEIFASSLVTDVHLIIAFVLTQVYGMSMSSLVYSMTIGAVISNVFTLILVLIEAIKNKDEF